MRGRQDFIPMTSPRHDETKPMYVIQFVCHDELHECEIDLELLAEELEKLRRAK